jgi:hypothetical protein
LTKSQGNEFIPLTETSRYGRFQFDLQCSRRALSHDQGQLEAVALVSCDEQWTRSAHIGVGRYRRIYLTGSKTSYNIPPRYRRIASEARTIFCEEACSPPPAASGCRLLSRRVSRDRDVKCGTERWPNGSQRINTKAEGWLDPLGPEARCERLRRLPSPIIPGC